MDDAPVRRVRHRGRIQQALPVSFEAGSDRAVGRLRPAHPDRLRLGRSHGQRRGRQGGCGDRLARGHGDPAPGHPARAGFHVDDDQRDRRHAPASLSTGGREAGMPAGEDHGHSPERHSQGVRGPGNVHLSAPTVDAFDHRPFRLLRAEPAQLEHDLDLGLPHAGGRFDRGRGDRLHPQPRHRLRRGGAGGRPCRRRFRAARLVLLCLPHGLLRRGGEVSRRPAHVGADHARPVPRSRRARAGVALSHADWRGDSDCAATPQ